MAKFTGNLAQVTRVGLDLAKNVFQIHGVDAQGEVVVVRKLRRGEVLEFTLLKVRPISCKDCPAFQRLHMSFRCCSESLNRLLKVINTTL